MTDISDKNTMFVLFGTNIKNIPKYISEDSKQLALAYCHPNTSVPFSDRYIESNYIYEKSHADIYTVDQDSLYNAGDAAFGRIIPVLINPSQEVLTIIDLQGIGRIELQPKFWLYHFVIDNFLNV